MHTYTSKINATAKKEIDNKKHKIENYGLRKRPLPKTGVQIMWIEASLYHLIVSKNEYCRYNIITYK